jgi:inorganic triphosphatase YgiF
VLGSAHDATCAALGVDFAGVTACQVYYLDTRDRALQRDGVVVRVRSTDGQAASPARAVLQTAAEAAGSPPAPARQNR